MRLLWFNLRVDRERPSLAFAVDWLNTVAEQVEHIDVITMYAGNYQVRDNVQVYSVGKEKSYSEPRRVVEFYRILGRLLHDHRYDACFAHMMPLFAVLAAPILRIKRIPIILWYTHKSVTWTLRVATWCVHRVVTASRESFRIKSRKVRVIGHGIDTKRFVPVVRENGQQRVFTILTVSRFSSIKRINLIIQAVALMRQKRPELPLYLKIVGGPLTDRDQEYVAELQQQVGRYGLQETVEFVGSVPFQDITPYYQQADCFVSMSETGSIDKAVLEAMSCGVVVVANRAFTAVLGEDLAKTWVINSDAEQVCDRLLLLAALPASQRHQLGEQLRALVVRDHGLQSLCTRIVSELEGCVA